MNLGCENDIFKKLMDNALVIKGRLTGPKSVELEQPVTGAKAEVEVVIHPLHTAPPENGETIAQFLRRLPPGKLTKQQIDKQVQDERASWGDR
jgi:hypothetical protein